MLCKCCESISLNFHRSRLLAKEYTSVAGGLPSPILEPLRIEHQPNLHALQRSAEAGCELCSLFVNFIECKERQPWEGSLISHLPFLVTYRYTPCYGSDYVKSDHRHGVHGFSLRQDVQSNSGRCEWPMTLFTNKGMQHHPVEAPCPPSLSRDTKPAQACHVVLTLIVRGYCRS